MNEKIKEQNNTHDLSEIVNKHKKIFSMDLGDELADSFVNGLYTNMFNGHLPNSLELMEKGKETFFSLAKDTYGPLLCSFVDWILKGYAKSGKKGKINFMARDGIPLYHIANTLVEEKNYGIDKNQLNYVYLTRKIAGESDEIAGFDKHSKDMLKVKKYLQKEGVNDECLLVDMGMYGSLYNKGYGTFWDEDRKPGIIFLYSKNPNILGYINHICEDKEGKMTEEQKHLGNKIVDGSECVNPQQDWSPGELLQTHIGLIPVLKPIEDEYIQAWSTANSKGYKQAAKHFVNNGGLDVNQELKKLQLLSDIAALGTWTGILPNITTEWSLKNEFLNNTLSYQQKTGKQGWHVDNAPPFGESAYELK